MYHRDGQRRLRSRLGRDGGGELRDRLRGRLSKPEFDKLVDVIARRRSELQKQLRRAVGEGLRGRCILFRRRRRGADHDGEIVEQPVRPGELEERVHENHN